MRRAVVIIVTGILLTAGSSSGKNLQPYQEPAYSVFCSVKIFPFRNLSTEHPNGIPRLDVLTQEIKARWKPEIVEVDEVDADDNLISKRKETRPSTDCVESITFDSKSHVATVTTRSGDFTILIVNHWAYTDDSWKIIDNPESPY